MHFGLLCEQERASVRAFPGPNEICAEMKGAEGAILCVTETRCPVQSRGL